MLFQLNRSQRDVFSLWHTWRRVVQPLLFTIMACFVIASVFSFRERLPGILPINSLLDHATTSRTPDEPLAPLRIRLAQALDKVPSYRNQRNLFQSFRQRPAPPPPDGKEHMADVVVVACGGWTPSIVPEVEGILETTAGSVVTISLPKDRPDLWSRFSPENFPVWAYGLQGHFSPEFGGFYGFPRTPEGRIKIGYRGRKWTNYQTDPKTGKRLSVPKTKHTADKAVNLPIKAINYLKTVVGDMFPELTGVGITDTRMCWYTDSLDNSFVIDYVPGYGRSLFVASGGSGHGFKFLPVLGKHVVNALEQVPDQFSPLWKWRVAAPSAHANGLEEGEMSGRNLASLEMAEESDWVWGNKGAVKVGSGEAVVPKASEGVDNVAAKVEVLEISG